MLCYVFLNICISCCWRQGTMVEETLVWQGNCSCIVIALQTFRLLPLIYYQCLPFQQFFSSKSSLYFFPFFFFVWLFGWFCPVTVLDWRCQIFCSLFSFGGYGLSLDLPNPGNLLWAVTDLSVSFSTGYYDLRWRLIVSLWNNICK